MVAVILLNSSWNVSAIKSNERQLKCTGIINGNDLYQWPFHIKHSADIQTSLSPVKGLNSSCENFIFKPCRQ